MLQILRSPHANSIPRRMEEHVVVPVANYAGIFSGVGATGVGPRLQIFRPGPTDAVLLVQAPPPTGLGPALQQKRVDHSSHLLERNLRALDPQQFWRAPVLQVA